MLRWLICAFKGHKLVNYERHIAEDGPMKGRPDGYYKFDCSRCGAIIRGWGRP